MAEYPHSFWSEKGIHSDTGTLQYAQIFTSHDEDSESFLQKQKV